MNWVRILASRLAAIVRRSRLDAELDDELRAHIEMATEENRKRGLSAGEARTAALREIGGVTQTKESYRVQSGIPFIDQAARDLRFAFRQLRNSPAFALTAVLTLALGLGANTAIFSLIDALLLRPLPVPHADELSVLRYLRSDDSDLNYSFCAPMFRALEKRHDLFSDVAAFSNRSGFQVRGDSGNVEVPGAIVSGEFFTAMQTAPLLGRALTPQDDRPGGTSTGFAVVISEGFWQRWFDRAPDVIGRRLIIANAPFTIAGVMPKSFIGADPTRVADLYVPLWAEPVVDAPYNNIAGGHHAWWMRVIARRRAGVTLAQASAGLAAASNSILDVSAEGDAEWLKAARDHHFTILAEPGSKGYTFLRAEFAQPLRVVFALCAAMLLLACLNLASLLMARSAARQRELATRMALGATRRRLIQQLMIESALLALLGTVSGMFAAPAVSRSLAAMLSNGMRGASIDTAIDLRVFAFVAVAALVATVLIGLLPALRATAKNLNEQIKSGAKSLVLREKGRILPRVLMGFEVALALVLVVGAGLLGTSLVRLYLAGLGFDPKNVADLALDMGKQGLEGDALIRWYHEYGEALRRLPGVKNVSFASETPMGDSIWTSGFRSPITSEARQLYMSHVAPEFFATMRIPMVAGRDFRWDDTMASGRKVILSRSAARFLFPGQNPIGRQVKGGQNSTFEVIGVVGDIRYGSVRRDAPPEGYVTITQADNPKPSYTAVVRIDGALTPFADAARKLAEKMAPEIPAPVLTTVSSEIDSHISSARMMAVLAVFFATCALLVTAIGLYGTLAYSAARRTGEIGIRMALGARRAQVMALVFRENAWIAACGSLLGLAVTLLSARALASFLYGISANDPWVLIESVATLALIASAASLVPAIRAARVEPMTALRTE
jgi:predicted permease